MPTAHARLAAAALAVTACLAGQASAGPPAIPLPSHTVSAPPAANAPGPPLIGSWRDGLCLLLPPGVTPFEAVSDTLTFHADGTFRQTIEKATGRMQTRGTYAVAGSRLTLSYQIGVPKPALYEFSRTGGRLSLQPVGLSRSAVRTLTRIGASD